MKLPLAFLAIALIASSGCDRVRKLADQVGKKGQSMAGSPVDPGPLVTEIPFGAYDTFIGQRNRVVIVNFTAGWSGECRQLDLIFDRITKEKAGLVVVGNVDVTRYKELAKQEGVRDVPDVRIYRDGRQVDRFIGLPNDDAIAGKVETHSKGLTLGALAKKDDPAPHATALPMTKDWMPDGIRVRQR